MNKYMNMNLDEHGQRASIDSEKHEYEANQARRSSNQLQLAKVCFGTVPADQIRPVHSRELLSRYPDHRAKA